MRFETLLGRRRHDTVVCINTKQYLYKVLGVLILPSNRGHWFKRSFEIQRPRG
jgi:hypothetical protein